MLSMSCRGYELVVNSPFRPGFPLLSNQGVHCIQAFLPVLELTVSRNRFPLSRNQYGGRAEQPTY